VSSENQKIGFNDGKNALRKVYAIFRLGFSHHAGAGLFQLLGAPGLWAHGVELANKPATAMPFVKDENYVIKYE